MSLTNRWNQLAVFLLILGINIILFSLLAAGSAFLIWHTLSLDDPAVARYVNTVAIAGIFGFTSLFYAYLVNRNKTFSYLKMNQGVRWNTVLVILFFLCVSMPALGWIVKWNEGLYLPQFFSHIEQWMRVEEEKLAVLTEQMLAGTSLSILFANLLTIAIVPAICEELLFRGVLLSWLKNSFGNKHLAVWLSAIVFSAIHVQFFGFFPRMLLGVYLGYLFLWTGSLWTSIIAHFLNNAVLVVAAFFYNIGYMTTDYEQIGSGGEKTWVIILSCCLTVVFIWYLWRNRKE